MRARGNPRLGLQVQGRKGRHVMNSRWVLQKPLKLSLGFSQDELRAADSTKNFELIFPSYSCKPEIGRVARIVRYGSQGH